MQRSKNFLTALCLQAQLCPGARLNSGSCGIMASVCNLSSVWRNFSCPWHEQQGHEVSTHRRLHREDCTERIAQRRLHREDCTERIAQRRLHMEDCTEKIAQRGLHREDCTWKIAQRGLHREDCTEIAWLRKWELKLSTEKHSMKSTSLFSTDN